MGISIAVPEPFGNDLRQKRAAFGDPAAATVPTHVTLAPPFEVADDEHEALAESLSKVAAAHEPFMLRLRGTDSFRPLSPVVYVAVVDGHDSVIQIAQTVQETLGGQSVEFPIHPHVTVAHRLDDQGLDRALDELADYEACFEVAMFVLYKHEEPAGWVPTMEFPLG